MEQVDIKGFENYQITDDGMVWSKKNNKWLKQTKDRNGYLAVCIYGNNGILKLKKIHRLVAEAFIPNLDGKPCVDHKNTVKTDNRVDNLQWCTYAENNRNELTRLHLSEALKGKTVSDNTRKKLSEIRKGKRLSEETRKKLSDIHKGKKLTEEHKIKISEAHKGKPHPIQKNNPLISKKVYQYTLEGEFVRKWDSVNECARNGYSLGHVAACCRGERHTHKGYIWKYAH